MHGQVSFGGSSVAVIMQHRILADFISRLLLSLHRCDADPSALANYVVALVKKDKPEKELKAFCADQLDVFLQKGTVLCPVQRGSCQQGEEGWWCTAVAFKTVFVIQELFLTECEGIKIVWFEKKCLDMSHAARSSDRCLVLLTAWSIVIFQASGELLTAVQLKPEF